MSHVRVASIYYWGPRTALPDAMKQGIANKPRTDALQAKFHAFLDEECGIRREQALLEGPAVLLRNLGLLLYSSTSCRVEVL